jgi:hypothetical protein
MGNGKIAVLIPTKDRLEDFIIFADSWVNTTEGHSDVIVGIDIGDETYEGIKDKYPFKYVYIEPKPFLDILNELALKYSNEYDYVGFMEDDCNFNTQGWESIFINKINEIGDNAIVWGNDLLNGENIVGLPFMNSKLINKLGYMCPPEIKYLWADHFWKRIGQAVGSLHYFPDVIIEHRHYSTGKREKDEVSEHVDSVGAEDFVGFNQVYMKTNFRRDINKLK